MSAPPALSVVSDSADWVACADAVAALLQDIARREVLPRWQTLCVVHKDDGSLLTDADHAVQNALAEALPAIYPAPLIGEESPAAVHATWNDGNTTAWVADPIDGTSNFVAGWPWYAVSVALVVRGETVLGVTYAPALGQCWQAVRGGGAFCHGQRLWLPPELRPLNSCLIGVDMSFLSASLRHAIADCSPAGMAHNEQNAPWRGWRSLGASTLEWCALAAGQIQAYVHGGQMPWDALAGRLILAEAGGCSAPLDAVLGHPATSTHQQISRTAYAAAAPGVWTTWQDWLRGHQT